MCPVEPPYAGLDVFCTANTRIPCAVMARMLRLVQHAAMHAQYMYYSFHNSL